MTAGDLAAAPLQGSVTNWERARPYTVWWTSSMCATRLLGLLLVYPKRTCDSVQPNGRACGVGSRMRLCFGSRRAHVRHTHTHTHTPPPPHHPTPLPLPHTLPHTPHHTTPHHTTPHHTHTPTHSKKLKSRKKRRKKNEAWKNQKKYTPAATRP